MVRDVGLAEDLANNSMQAEVHQNEGVLFLLIFSCYWVVFWQEFIALPLYISTYINPKADTELILVTDPLVVIFLTMVIGFLTKRMHAFHAIVLGTLVSSLAWILLIVHPSVRMAVTVK